MADAFVRDGFLAREPEGIEPPPLRPPRRPVEVDSVELRFAGHARLHPAAWEQRVARLIEDEAPEDVGDLRVALRALELRDENGDAWSYDGSSWWRWDGPRWTAGRPSSELRLASTDIEVPALRAPYVATHRVPGQGLPVWTDPDPTAAPVATLDPGLDVMALEWRDDGWTRVLCSNTWSGWVDGRLLAAV